MNQTAAPPIALDHLDHLWLQVAGTLCNYTCAHCFISCSPKNHSLGMLSRAAVQQVLEQSTAVGVKEYYFTGGEPFLNPEMVEILIDTLAYGPASVLTNASVLKDDWLARLALAEAESLYSLEFRVSLDGFSAETNDPVRGKGTFARTVRGIQQLVAHGFLPIITAARVWPLEQEAETVAGFVRVLREVGYTRPRLKILPTLQLGAEQQRTRGYAADERVTCEMLEGYEVAQLLCSYSRIVSDRGVHVCPILVDTPDARLGDTLQDALQSYTLQHGACYTCYQHGALCANPSSGNGRL